MLNSLKNGYTEITMYLYYNGLRYVSLLWIKAKFTSGFSLKSLNQNFLKYVMEYLIKLTDVGGRFNVCGMAIQINLVDYLLFN